MIEKNSKLDELEAIAEQEVYQDSVKVEQASEEQAERHHDPSVTAQHEQTLEAMAEKDPADFKAESLSELSQRLEPSTWFDVWQKETHSNVLGGAAFEADEGWELLSQDQQSLVAYASTYITPQGVAYIDIERERMEAVEAAKIDANKASKMMTDHRQAPSPAAALMGAAANLLRAGSGLVNSISGNDDLKDRQFNEKDLLTGSGTLNQNRLKAMLMQTSSDFGDQKSADWELSNKWTKSLVKKDENNAKLLGFSFRSLPKLMTDSDLNFGGSSMSLSQFFSSLKEAFSSLTGKDSKDASNTSKVSEPEREG